MANLQRVSFEALNVSGENYMSWVLDARIHLTAMNLGETIMEEKDVSLQDKAKAMILLRHHLHEQLKIEYLTVSDPLELWKDLQERYEHNRLILLPKARYDWINLRIQDFKTVNEYASEVFKIVSKLKLCGETITDADMLEKTFSTFHASNMLLQQQYRERRFNRFSELIACLLIAEQNNELLMKNHQLRPTGAAPFPEVNVAEYKGKQQSSATPEVYAAKYRGQHKWRGRGGGRRNDRYYHGKRYNIGHQKWNSSHQNKSQQKKKGNDKKIEHVTNEIDNACYRCGKSGHWSRVCRTPKHIVQRFQESLKEKIKHVETNYLNLDNCIDEPSTSTQLDVSDFLD